MPRLRKGETPAPTGVFTTCKVCQVVKDDCEFKWSRGKRLGLVCRPCSRAIKARQYAEDEALQIKTRQRAIEWERANPERVAERSKLYRSENIEAIQARRVSYHAENADRINGKSRLWYATNRTTALESQKLYRELNEEACKAARARHYQKTKGAHKERMRKWRELNPRRATAYTRAYLLRREMRTPVWSESKAILEFYYLCPPDREVDHVIPLKGKLVSGLHVLSNLQYLTRSANAAKSNKFNPETFDNAKPNGY